MIEQKVPFFRFWTDGSFRAVQQQDRPRTEQKKYDGGGNQQFGGQLLFFFSLDFLHRLEIPPGNQDQYGQDEDEQGQQ